jgi:polysaccharide biosynthesis protein PslG
VTVPEHPAHQSRSGEATCLRRVLGVLLILVSLGAGAWNLITHSPWEETATRPVQATETRYPHTAVNPHSVNTFLSQEVEPWKREKTVEMISMAGIGWIKEGFPWSELEPAEGSHWDPEHQQDTWQKYDEIVDLAESYGLRIIARLDHTPPWARPDGSDYHSPPSDVRSYGRFVEAFVERYSGRIQHIQIWNEPNLAREWGGEIDPDGYAELLEEAYQRANAADPDVVVLSAPMAMTNETSDRAIPEFDYWEALYEVGANEFFDVLTATGYGIDQPPDDPPSRDVINLRRIELLRDLMAEHGDTSTPIWLTEYGWNASPDSIPAEERQWGSVSDREQAEWTTAGVKYMDENWDWFGVSSIWYFRQVGLIPPDSAEYYFAMVDLEFTPRPVYLSVRDDASERRIALPGTYGPMESPVRQTGRWRRVEDQLAPTGETIISDHWGSEIRVEFSGTDLTLIPGDLEELGGWMYVTLNGEPIDNDIFSIDVLDRTYLDLDALSGDVDRLPVVEQHGTTQPQQVNTFVLHIHEEASFALRGIEVEYQRSLRQFSMIGLFSLAGLVTGTIMVVRRSRVL